MNEITDDAIAELNNVTALEAWCLAAAIASIVAAGDQPMGNLIAQMADDLHTRIKDGNAPAD